jgi:hypothetical protein
MKPTAPSVRALLVAACLVPSLAWASIGKVSALQGQGTRTPKAGAAVKLAVGSEVELGDTLEVKKGSHLKLTLNDASELFLGFDEKVNAGKLTIDEASFQNQERQGFSAKLWAGKVWAKVTKALAGSDAKFEVTTQRAVAGVRGTIFRVDATKVVSGTRPNLVTHPGTIVRVAEGKVAVEAQVRKKPEAGATPTPKPKGPKGPRTQVAGPTEISKAEWEKKFVELQANQQVTVGEELWQEAEYSPEAKTDAFAQFVEQNP